MDLAEAMEEFEMLGHNFYVFLDKESSSVKVLYLRDDGNVGLIDPEILYISDNFRSKVKVPLTHL